MIVLSVVLYILLIAEKCSSAKYTPALQLDDDGLTDLLDDLSLPSQRINGYRVDRSYQPSQWAYQHQRPRFGYGKYYKDEGKPKGDRGKKHHPLFNG